MFKIILLFSSLIFSNLAFANAEPICAVGVTVAENISASTLDYLTRAESRAKELDCGAILIRLNTPGGSLQSTRLIVERILASPYKYLCLVTPEGGHAGSAGAIILQACHLNGGVNVTNLGAATPVSGQGGEMGADLRNKIVNDTVSWLEGITKLRGRNLEFSKEIVTEAKAVSSEEAVRIKALDILAKDEADFLEQAKAHQIYVSVVNDFLPDLRHKILGFVADPEFAYLLFMGSLGLLYLELSHPGLIAPGVLGGIGLVLSLVVFHKLDVVWGGLGLIVLGIAFLVLELFVASFGILAVGGLISIFVGSLFLFDSQMGYSLPLSLIFSVVMVLGAFILGIGFVAVKTLKLKSKDVDHDLQEAEGTVLKILDDGHSGQMEILGETWMFESDEVLKPQDKVRVLSRDSLKLKIRKA